MELKLNRGKIALIDDDDFERVSQLKWYFASFNSQNTGYVQCVVNKKTIRLHRFITKASSGKFVDHKNGDGLDNRKSNLRICSKRQNVCNQRKRRGKYLSNYKGVTKSANGLKWCAQLRTGEKTYHLGVFDVEKNAALAYDKKARETYGEFARTNF